LTSRICSIVSFLTMCSSSQDRKRSAPASEPCPHGKHFRTS
jgi:hypothetical protein